MAEQRLDVLQLSCSCSVGSKPLLLRSSGRLTRHTLLFSLCGLQPREVAKATARRRTHRKLRIISGTAGGESARNHHRVLWHVQCGVVAAAAAQQQCGPAQSDASIRLTEHGVAGGLVPQHAEHRLG